MHTTGYRIIALGMAVLMLSSCASARSYLQDYRGHPQARVDCAGYLERSVTAETSGGLTASNQDKGESPQSVLQAQGKVASQAAVTALKDRKGSIYEACIEAWELQAAQDNANRINHCLWRLNILLPFLPFCYLLD